MNTRIATKIAKEWKETTKAKYYLGESSLSEVEDEIADICNKHIIIALDNLLSKQTKD